MMRHVGNALFFPYESASSWDIGGLVHELGSDGY